MTHRQTRGQTALMFTLGLTAMFGMVGLVSDVGYVYYRKQNAQAAAQAAAAAAIKAAYNTSGGNFVCGSNSVVCYSNYPPTYTCPSSISGNGSNDLEVGCLYAAANGYSGNKVTFQSGTGSVEGVYATYWVIARVSEKLPLLFSAVTGSTSTTLTARSVAAYIPAASGGCVYVIAPNGSSLVTTGNGYLATGCGVWVDSNSSNAANLNGANTNICVGTWDPSTSTCTASTTNTMQIVGSSPGYTCGGSNFNCIQPAPNTGAANSGDPLAGLPVPSYNPSSCTGPPTFHGHSATTISNSGVVCFNSSVSVSNNQELDLSPGTYVFTGGSGCGLSVAGQGTLKSTGGVTLYFANPCSVSFSGGATIGLSAPTSGTYNGILMFQDRNDPSTASLTGGAAQILQGVAYFPDALLHYTGGTNSANGCGLSTCTQSLSIVAYNLDIKGNSYIQAAGSSPYLTTFSGVAMIE